MKTNMGLKKLKGTLLLIVVVLAIYGVFTVLSTDKFLNVNTLKIIFQQSFMPAVIAAGLYFILTMGMFDFSIGAILVFSGILGGLASQYIGYVGLVAVTILVAVALEMINGFLYIKLKVPSMIISVGFLMVLEAVSTFFNGSRGVTLGFEMRIFGREPYNVIIGVIGLVIAAFLLSNTVKGLKIRAIGSNELIAKSAGIRVNEAKMWGYIFCGLLVGIGSVMNLCYGGSLQPVLNMSSTARNYTPILGCFFGLAFKNVMNPIVAIYIGEFIIKVITTGLMTLGWDSIIQEIVTGCVLLIVVALTMRNNRDIHVIVK